MIQEFFVLHSERPVARDEVDLARPLDLRLENHLVAENGRKHKRHAEVSLEEVVGAKVSAPDGEEGFGEEPDEYKECGAAEKNRASGPEHGFVGVATLEDSALLSTDRSVEADAADGNDYPGDHEDSRRYG